MSEAAEQEPHHFAVEQLAVHREGDGQVEWHETQIDVFFVRNPLPRRNHGQR